MLNNEKYEIFDGEEFRNFDGLLIQHKELFRIVTEFDSIDATDDHRFLTNMDEWVYVRELEIGTELKNCGKVVSIRSTGIKHVYDPINVEVSNKYQSNKAISHNCALLYIDECSFVPQWNSFFTSVFPTLTSGKDTKMLFTSTPCGINHYYDFWQGAINGTNGFVPIKATWERVPGRDEAWKQKILATMNNNMEQFAQEFEGEFIGSSGTLISGACLKRMLSGKIVPISSADGVSIYNKKEDGHVYMLIADVSHGKGLDYSVFHVIDVSSPPYKQVCTYRSNTITPSDYSQIINNIGKYYNNAFCLVENNDIGAQVTHQLWNEHNYDNVLSSQSNGRAGKKLVFGVPSKSDIGIRTTTSVKSLGCSVLKLIVEQDQLLIVDKETIGELSTFSKKNSSYAAETDKNDDCVMPLVLFAWMTTTELFKEITESNLVGGITDYTENQLASSLLSVGVFSDGVSDAEEKKYVRFGDDPSFWTMQDWNQYGNQVVF